MADSGITKKALAAALKEQMKLEPFAKISVAEICDRCEMHRKSFYYHFKDKYELINWIFDTEFAEYSEDCPPADSRAYMYSLLHYLWEQREFYRGAMQIDGQNSFGEHFRGAICRVVERELAPLLEGDEAAEFYVEFITDSFVGAIGRWLLDRDSVEPDAFLARLRRVVEAISKQFFAE